jgi:N-terminal phage replisome organiser (Phage_rep_org_N)
MQWLRLYNEVTSDRKLRRLPPAQRWLWIAVLVIARQSPEAGRLLLAEGVPVTNEDIADAAAIPMSDVECGILAFSQSGMLHLDGDVWVVTNWDRRQRESDDVKQRVRAYRERNRNVTGNVSGNVTETRQIQIQIQNKRIRSNGSLDIDSIAPVADATTAPSPNGSKPDRHSKSAQPEVTVANEAKTSSPPIAPAPPAPASLPVKARPRDPIWDTLVELFYEPMTPGEKSKIGKVVHDLKKAGATPEEMRRRASNHATMHESGVINWSLTPPALANNWGELARIKPPAHGSSARNGARAAPTPPAPLPPSSPATSPWAD